MFAHNLRCFPALPVLAVLLLSACGDSVDPAADTSPPRDGVSTDAPIVDAPDAALVDSRVDTVFADTRPDVRWDGGNDAGPLPVATLVEEGTARARIVITDAAGSEAASTELRDAIESATGVRLDILMEAQHC